MDAATGREDRVRRLFVNADDFGLTESVSRGIVEAMETGVVGGTTAMVCVPGAFKRLERLGPAVVGRLGLHLQLTGGVPCLAASAVPSLVTPQGHFPRKKTAVVDVDPGDVRREWRAQLELFRSLGVEPSHLDAHHHIHSRPEVFPVFVELAAELGVPARAVTDSMRRSFVQAGIPHADTCVTGFFGESVSSRLFLNLVDEAFAALGGGGTVEVMVHPGYCDGELEAISTYAAGRDLERRLLTEPSLAAALAARDIEVVGPRSLGTRYI